MSYDDTDPLTIVGGVIDTARARLTAFLPLTVPRYDTHGGNTPLNVRAARDLLDIFDAWDTAVAAIDAAHTPLQDTWARYDLTLEAKLTLAQAAIDATAATVRSAMDSAATTARALVAALQQAVLPPRPTPADATQEAALTNLRSDLRLLFDHVHADNLPEAMLDELKRRAIAGDALAVWFLAGDAGWPAVYLRSRGGAAELYDCRVADTLAPYDGTPPDAGESARTILATLKGPKGLIGALVAMTNLATWKFDGLAGFAPGVTNSWESAFVMDLPA